jgi:hypothetical protein
VKVSLCFIGADEPSLCCSFSRSTCRFVRLREIFLKTAGGLARARLIGRWKISQEMLMTGAAYRLLRLARLEAAE